MTRCLLTRRLPRLLPVTLLAVALAGPGASTAAPGKRAAADRAAADRAGADPAAAADTLPGVAEKTAGLERLDGLLTLHLDRARGKVWLEMSAPGATFLYVEGLTAGLGSNPVGLDRSQLGETRLLTLRRVGGRLLAEQPNLAYRALSDDPDEQRAVRESFATSVLWAGEVAAADPDGRFLVDLTSFVVRDAHDSAARMQGAGQGSFRLDEARSVIDPDSVLVFPDNLEMEALLTFASDAPGRLVRSVSPTGEAVTLRQHHSLIRLPEPGYTPRPFHPQAGSFAIEFQDYAVPLDEPLTTRWIVRHRVRPDRPIIYHVDRGVPEPVRSALVEGASWWADAFAAAGHSGGFRVELLPEGAHPLDVRYNVIQWVHRSTRGWSYGGGIIDPRTGEMVKGHVLLGSLRVRQDRLLFEGLAGTAKTGTGAPGDPVELALARIRQLSAHEVGHTLGLAHNFAASSYGRASVMDYPAPLVKVTPAGDLDFSEAYAVGMGEWDLFAIRFAYGDEPITPDGSLLFLTEPDARPAGTAEPRASLWDNGPDPVAALETSLQVRRIALSRFGPDRIAPGRQLAALHEVLVPVYLHHRYQLDAAVKVIGGLEYAYATRGDGLPPARMVDPGRQARALDLILSLLEPEALDIPEPVLALLTPRPGQVGDSRETFDGRSGPAFDPLAAAETAARMAVDALLHPHRANRLVDLHRRDPAQPGLEPVLDALAARAVERPASDPPRHAELRRVAARAVVDGLLSLAASDQAGPGVRARVGATLTRLAADLPPGPAADVRRFLERPAPPAPAERPAPAEPPGSPIGAGTSGLPGAGRLDGCSLP